MRISDWSSDVCSSDLGVVDLIDRRHAVDVGDDAARVVDRQDRRGLGAIFGHARAHSLGIVVGAALELVAAADVARVRDLRQLVAIVIAGAAFRSEEHTSELQSLMRISYAVFCLKKKKKQ